MKPTDKDSEAYKTICQVWAKAGLDFKQTALMFTRPGNSLWGNWRRTRRSRRWPGMSWRRKAFWSWTRNHEIIEGEGHTSHIIRA